MDPLTDTEIRASFVNCSKGEAKRLPVPRDLEATAWQDLDFLGWRDGGAPDRAYLVTPYLGRTVGVTLRVPPAARANFFRSSVCSICLTPHVASDVTLLAARRAGEAGRRGDTVGRYMCADLACSLYVRGRKKIKAGVRYEETLTVDEQIARARGNLEDFLAEVLKG